MYNTVVNIDRSRGGKGSVGVYNIIKGHVGGPSVTTLVYSEWVFFAVLQSLHLDFW